MVTKSTTTFTLQLYTLHTLHICVLRCFLQSGGPTVQTFYWQYTLFCARNDLHQQLTLISSVCLRRLVTRRSMRRPEFHHRSVHVTFVVCKMELRRVSFPEHVGLFLSTSFTQCSMFILIYMLLIERRKPGKNRKKINDFSENEINI